MMACSDHLLITKRHSTCNRIREESKKIRSEGSNVNESVRLDMEMTYRRLEAVEP